MTRSRFAPLAITLLAVPALAASVPEPDGYRMDHYRAPVPSTLRGAQVVDSATLARMLPHHPVLIDVLPAPAPPPDSRPSLPRLPLPHRDLPGSHWLPDVGRGALAPATEAWFRTRVTRATHGDLNQPVVLYCLSQCWMSWNAAKRLVGYGYTHVVWYPDGADGWEASGRALVLAVPEG